MGLMQRLLGKAGGELGEVDWTKVLFLAGGTAAAAGWLWYLFRDDKEEGLANGDGDGLSPKGAAYRVCDPKGSSIGIRQGPDVMSARTGMQLHPGQVFLVEEVVKTDEEQTYLKLADGRGWAFTHSSRDGRQLCEKLSPEEAGSKMQNMPLEKGWLEKLNAIKAMRKRPAAPRRGRSSSPGWAYDEEAGAARGRSKPKAEKAAPESTASLVRSIGPDNMEKLYAKFPNSAPKPAPQEVEPQPQFPLQASVGTWLTPRIALVQRGGVIEEQDSREATANFIRSAFERFQKLGASPNAAAANALREVAGIAPVFKVATAPA